MLLPFFDLSIQLLADFELIARAMKRRGALALFLVGLCFEPKLFTKSLGLFRNTFILYLSQYISFIIERIYLRSPTVQESLSS